MEANSTALTQSFRSTQRIALAAAGRPIPMGRSSDTPPQRGGERFLKGSSVVNYIELSSCPPLWQN